MEKIAFVKLQHDKAAHWIPATEIKVVSWDNHNGSMGNEKLHEILPYDPPNPPKCPTKKPKMGCCDDPRTLPVPLLLTTQYLAYLEGTDG